MDLNSFDPSTMTWAAQMAHPHMAGDVGGPFQEIIPEAQDHQSLFSYAYAGSEDLHHHMAAQPTPSIKRYSTLYEDPFSDVVSTFDVPGQADQEEEPSPIDRGHKLLSFSSPQYNFQLLDYSFRRSTIAMMAQLNGMFLIAESPWSAAGEAQNMPSVLTCYRRNLFQVSGEITMPRTLQYIMTDAGEQPVFNLELVIQATESTEQSPVKIISVPWKTPAVPGSAPVAEEKSEQEPNPISLDMSNARDNEGDFAVFPFSWKRLQFRIATANNGRRKELQQHYVVRLKIMATLATGGRVCIAEVMSSAMMVRGRSPRNFQSRKDMPLNGSAGARKQTRAPSGDSKRPKLEPPTSVPVKTETAVDALQDVWKTPFQDSAIRTSPLPGANVYPSASPGIRAGEKGPSKPAAAPISLKLVEDETPKDSQSSQPTPEPRAAKRIQIPPRPPSFSINAMNSPDESADLLYEYFPLSLSDWSEPVDAVYRPHVVHHIRTKTTVDPSDPLSGRSVRSKRMYVE